MKRFNSSCNYRNSKLSFNFSNTLPFHPCFAAAEETLDVINNHWDPGHCCGYSEVRNK